MLRDYLKRVVDLVNTLTEPDSGDSVEAPVEESKNQNGFDLIESQATGSVPDSQNTENSESNGILSWIPNLLTTIDENPMLHYMNSFASMGVHSSDENETENNQESEKPLVVTKDISKIQVPENNDVLQASEPQNDNSFTSDNDLNSNWTSGFSIKTSRVWEQIKNDFSEVVHSVSEPKDAVCRTASSVRDRIAAAANTVKNMNPNDFLLPDTEMNKTDGQFNRTTNVGNSNDVLTALPPELPSFPNIKQDVTQLIDSLYTGLMSTGTYFGLITPTENQSKDKSKHQARLDVLRADPATYELEPPAPPASSGIHSYRDWRSAYFDEDTCQPMNAIPLADAKNDEYNHLPIEELTQPPHPSPAELLEAYPFMRTYLTQLVHPDGEITDNRSITDADFWSRYYYHVWLLDSTEFRRRKLNERVESVSSVKQSTQNQSTWHGIGSDDGTVKDLSFVSQDEWPGGQFYLLYRFNCECFVFIYLRMKSGNVWLK
uniref:SJCHGC09083 protein n=1 Tax=Schistosoma japonicum TaxID=6182 RepID=Q5DG77_SCHJA|nr:SJCHGC09083 protein [Schistosoma japonicum]